MKKFLPKLKILNFIILLFAINANAQNTCSTALPINAGLTTIDVINGQNSNTGCTAGAGAEWFSYTPTQNYNLTITSDLQSNLCRDTFVNVYTGNCNSLVCLTSDDDSGILPCTTDNQSFLSKIIVNVVAGETYYIAWTNRYDSDGFNFELIEAPFVAPPCTTATPITAGTITVPEITDVNIPSTCSTATAAKWYAYTPTQNYYVTITSDLPANICKDTNFNIYTGACPSVLSCTVGDDNSGIVACNSGNTLSNLSKKTILVQQGVTYYFVWDNKWSALGFDFQLIENPVPCQSAIPITAGVTTVPQITGINITSTCSTATASKWYAYTPTQNYYVTVTSDLPANICKDTNFNIYTGSCPTGLTCTVGDDNSGVIACNSGNTFSNLSKKTFLVQQGVTYYIVWDNKWSALGFDFQLIENPVPCQSAIPITAGVTSVPQITGFNILSTCSTATASKWYVYTPSQNYYVTVTSDLPSNICKDTNFNIYTGACPSVLTCTVGDDNSGEIACNSGNTLSNLSKKSFLVQQGLTYYIVWDNKWSSLGFDFQIIENPVPCQSATPITAGITSVPQITGINIPSTCSTATASKWYAYTPTQNYRLTITSDLPANICKDTNFNVYTGSCSSGLTCQIGDDNSGVIACNSGNTLSNLSKFTFDVNAGVTYYIVWDNKWSNVNFDFEIIEGIIVIPIQYNTQTIPTINSNYNICVVDMNNDQLDDIVGVTQSNIKIHYQSTTGPFTVANIATSATSFLPTWSIAAGDYNKDGFSDLMYGNGQGAAFMKSNSTGTTFTLDQPGQYIFCQRTNFVDLNDDGHLDAFSCHDVDPNVYYLNDGLGNFTYYQSGVTPGAYNLGVLPGGGNYASLWTDYDNDGDSDMFISKCSGPPSELHRNDGNGIYTDISALAQINVTPVDSWSSAIDDFDNDGDMDIMIGTNGTSANHLFRNDLDKTNAVEEPFVDVTAGSGFHTNISANRDYVSYDFDNDGWVDILGSGNKIMFNKGNMVFEPTIYPSMGVGAIGDLNNDGFLDIQNNNSIKYAIPNNNNWVKIAYKGIQSNGNGIGARVEIYGAWGKQIRDVRSGEGFEFMSSLNTHFGIGQANSIDKLIVRWPSGVIDEILNPSINTLHKIVEGQTTLKNDSFTSNSEFKIYPNPVSDILNITLKNNTAEIKSAQIFDLTGRLLSDSKIINNTLDIKTLSKGTYILLIKNSEGKQFSEKFIKN